jgi:hypothetical protein
MPLNDGILGTVALAEESALGGSTTGSTYSIRGFREFDFSVQHPHRITKTNVWRLADEQSSPVQLYRGRFDVIASPDVVFNLVARTLLTQKSVVTSSPLETRVFRPFRYESPDAAGFKIFAAYENGPWLTFSGCQIEGFRIQMRAKELARCSVEWRALSLASVASDPSWTILDDTFRSHSPIDAVLKVDATDHSQATEFGFEIKSPLTPASVDRDGNVTAFQRTGSWQITGMIADYKGDTSDLDARARAGTATDLNAKIVTSTPTNFIEIDLPKVIIETGQSTPRNAEFPRGSFTYRVVNASILNPSSEPLLTIARPIP